MAGAAGQRWNAKKKNGYVSKRRSTQAIERELAGLIQKWQHLREHARELKRASDELVRKAVKRALTKRQRDR
jgi:hypothetical protein